MIYKNDVLKILEDRQGVLLKSRSDGAYSRRNEIESVMEKVKGLPVIDESEMKRLVDENRELREILADLQLEIKRLKRR